MGVYGQVWGYMKVYGGIWWYMEVYGGMWGAGAPAAGDMSLARPRFVSGRFILLTAIFELRPGVFPGSCRLIGSSARADGRGHHFVLRFCFF